MVYLCVGCCKSGEIKYKTVKDKKYDEIIPMKIIDNKNDDSSSSSSSDDEEDKKLGPDIPYYNLQNAHN